MNGVVFPVGFGYSKLLVLSDTVDNCKNSIGIHNAAAVGGIVKLTYAGDQVDSIYLNPGEKVACRAKRVWLNGTDPALLMHGLWA